MANPTWGGRSMSSGGRGPDKGWDKRADQRIVQQRQERINALKGVNEPWAQKEIARHTEALNDAQGRLKAYDQPPASKVATHSDARGRDQATSKPGAGGGVDDQPRDEQGRWT